MDGSLRLLDRILPWTFGIVVILGLTTPGLAENYFDEDGSPADGESEITESFLHEGESDDFAKTLFQWSYGTSFSGGPDRDEPLVTDRPDFTEASTPVGLGVIQLELGYTYTFDQSGTTSTNSDSYPETLLRIGLFEDWFELRLGWNYANQTTRTGANRTRVTGSEDLLIGAKIGLTPQEGWLPEMALIVHSFVPTGSGAFTGGQMLPGMIWIYGWEINDCISTAGQSQFNSVIDPETSRNYTEFSQSWTVGYSLTERVGSYTEWYGLFPSGADTAKPQHYVNGGFTYLVHNDLQLDFRAGVGINDAADDYFLGTGLSYRY